MSDHDPETWMWERARAILEQAERLQRPNRPGGAGPKRISWEPPVDVFETATELWIVVALPGVEPSQVQVQIEGSGLTVSGDRTLPEGFRNASVHRLELPHGHFERFVELPAGTYELGQRSTINGCLFLSLRKVN